jgi:predicted ArsR family transcriptional regulator
MTNQSSHAELELVAVTKRPEHAKGPSKKNQLVKLLSRKSGADAKAISAKFGWQPHTTRAALSGLRKAGLDLIKDPPDLGKPTRYRIVVAQEAVTAAENPDGQ